MEVLFSSFQQLNPGLMIKYMLKLPHLLHHLDGSLWPVCLLREFCVKMLVYILKNITKTTTKLLHLLCTTCLFHRRSHHLRGEFLWQRTRWMQRFTSAHKLLLFSLYAVWNQMILMDTLRIPMRPVGKSLPKRVQKGKQQKKINQKLRMWVFV